jgi:hypothetical protein
MLRIKKHQRRATVWERLQQCERVTALRDIPPV